MQREALLRRELDHRVKNNLAALLGLIRLSEDASLDGPATSERVRTAVRTMHNSHELISRSHGAPVGLEELLWQMLRSATAAGGMERVRMEGPTVRIAPARVGALGMALQELATNAVKHGALAGAHGTIDVSWELDEGATGRVRLVWREIGVRAARAGAGWEAGRVGMGLTLVRSLLGVDLEGSAAFELTGGEMTCTMGFATGCDQAAAMVAIGDAR